MSGAASDMETSNKIARAMVSMYGMSDKVQQNVSLYKFYAVKIHIVLDSRQVF